MGWQGVQGEAPAAVWDIIQLLYLLCSFCSSSLPSSMTSRALAPFPFKQHLRSSFRLPNFQCSVPSTASFPFSSLLLLGLSCCVGFPCLLWSWTMMVIEHATGMYLTPSVPSHWMANAHGDSPENLKTQASRHSLRRSMVGSASTEL